MKYTQEQLRAAFEKVQNAEHWKNPINSFCRDSEVAITAHAIRHFTGTEATFVPRGNGWVSVSAEGYRLGPCGDH